MTRHLDLKNTTQPFGRTTALWRPTKDRRKITKKIAEIFEFRRGENWFVLVLLLVWSSERLNFLQLKFFLYRKQTELSCYNYLAWMAVVRFDNLSEHVYLWKHLTVQSLANVINFWLIPIFMDVKIIAVCHQVRFWQNIFHLKV